jgi:hypothetical protein
MAKGLALFLSNHNDKEAKELYWFLTGKVTWIGLHSYAMLQ